MDRKTTRLHANFFSWHYAWYEPVLVIILAMLIFVVPTSAAMRFQDRSLYMQSTDPGDTTSYTVSFRYMSPDPVGSIDMLFCVDPIPYHECVTPLGLDVSNAELSEQLGDVGYSIHSQTTNRIVLTRMAVAPSLTATSSYKLDNIINPVDISQSFSVRLKTHTTPDATGDQIDFGSIKGQVTEGLVIETQVPPMLIFCLAQQVEYNCTGTNEVYYSNMGQLSPSDTLVTQSQMAVGTNATGGFAITARGAPMSAGINTIDSIESLSESLPGTNQFGINLVENAAPAVGVNPEGDWANAVVSPEYGVPNKFKFTSGDVVAYSPNVSLMKKFTVSYIVNSSESLRPGVYSTTVTYIASGRF